MNKILILIIVVLLIPLVSAKQGHMKLLAVKETSDGYEGAPADLYLEIKPGTGRVFLETFPLFKIDTQISTRFAKEIACDYLSVDCDNYDFIYTITADSIIIGGPSAGASIATLTIAILIVTKYFPRLFIVMWSWVWSGVAFSDSPFVSKSVT